MKCMMTLCAVALAAVAFADQPKGEGRQANGALLGIEPVMRLTQNPKMAERLGVTAEQVEKLKAVADNRAAMRDLQAKVRKGLERQSELMKAEKIDEAAILAAVDEVWEAKKAIARLQTQRVIGVRNVLSAEQVRKVLEAIREMRKNGRGKRSDGAKKESPAS